MAINKAQGSIGLEEAVEMLEKQKEINRQLFHACSLMKDMAKCISEIPDVVTEPGTKTYMSRIVDEMCIILDEIKNNIPVVEV